MTDQELNEETPKELAPDPDGSVENKGEELFDPGKIALPVSLLQGESGRVINASLRLYSKARGSLKREDERTLKKFKKVEGKIKKKQEELEDLLEEAIKTYNAEVDEVVAPLRAKVKAGADALQKLLDTAKDEPVGQIPSELQAFQKPRNTKARAEEQELVDGDDS